MRKFVCICLFLLVFASSAVADAWTHRAAITVNNAGGMMTDYTLRVSFGAANPELFDLSQANGADWRFRKKDGLTTLNHWMEWWSTDPDTAIALVKLDTLKPGADSIYLYFGNPSAISTSNGTATCPLFLDFPSDWTVSGAADILDMRGIGVDTVRRIALDTNSANNIIDVTREPGNIFINPLAPDSSMRYLFWYCTRRTVAYTQSDSEWMYQAKSSNGLAWTSMGRVDTLGGGAPVIALAGKTLI